LLDSQLGEFAVNIEAPLHLTAFDRALTHAWMLSPFFPLSVFSIFVLRLGPAFSFPSV
jgi:hypothetical protein